MKHKEAKKMIEQVNQNFYLSAKLVRILPADIDPVKHDDNGWDVEITDHTPPAKSGEGWSF